MVTFLDVIALATVFILVMIELIPEKPQRIVWGILLFLLGLFPFLKMIGWIKLDIYSLNLMKFVAIFIVIIVGELLFTEGLKETNLWLKIVSMIMGVVIIMLTSIPWMNEFDALSFQLPAYAPAIDFVLYLIAGGLTIVGAFLSEHS
jgi:hypothetical protein